MSRGNKSKRTGTNAERQLLKTLRKADPHGEWQSRTQGLSERRTDPPQHGWDVFSYKRNCWLECKSYERRITWTDVQGWAATVVERPVPEPRGIDPKDYGDSIAQSRAFPMSRHIVHRQKNSKGKGQWTIVEPTVTRDFPDITVTAEPLEQWLGYLLLHEGLDNERD